MIRSTSPLREREREKEQERKSEREGEGELQDGEEKGTREKWSVGDGRQEKVLIDLVNS